MSVQSELDRINNNVQSTLRTIADTGVSVAANANSDALPAAAAALANEKQDKLSGTAGQVVGFDADGNAVAQEAPSGGGGATWAGLPDKPVVMVGKPDTLEWDGDFGDRLQVETAIPGTPFVAHLVHLSESVPSIADLKNGATVVQNTNGATESVDISFEDIIDYGDVMEVGSFSIAAVDNAEGALEDGSTFAYPKAGVYAMWSDLSAVGMGITYGVSITIPGYTGFGQEKIAPSHLYQPDWNQNDSTQPDFIKNRPFGVGKSTILEGEFTLVAGENFGMPELGTMLADDFLAGFTEEEIAAGEVTLTVVRNGVEYACTSRQLEHLIVFGNVDLLMGEGDSGEPFVIMYIQGYLAYGDFAAQEGETVALEFLGDNIVKVPDKYLPKTADLIGAGGYLYASAANLMEGESGRMTKNELAAVRTSGVPIYVNGWAALKCNDLEYTDGVVCGVVGVAEGSSNNSFKMTTYYTAEYQP